jgi:histidine phosphotransfer protein HptB
MSRLNWNKTFALEQAADDAELLEELINIFKESYESDLAMMKEGIQKGDTKQIYSAAHSIKGASASLGIDGVKDLALKVEVDSRNGSTVIATENLDELEEMLVELKKL